LTLRLRWLLLILLSDGGRWQVDDVPATGKDNTPDWLHVLEHKYDYDLCTGTGFGTLSTG
jgi:hypothetical protein